MWQGPTLLGLVRRKSTEDPYLSAQNATTFIMGSVLPTTTTAKRLAIWLVIVEVQLLLLTTKDPLRNQVGNDRTQAKAYAVGNAGENQMRMSLQRKQENEEHLKLILELLKKQELYAKIYKCEFWIPKVQFLSHVIDSLGIHVDPAKIKSIKDWASPKTPKKIR
nr:putative reverse transcriptase domain-containing protein [Tanacetum cinerariifolium]